MRIPSAKVPHLLTVALVACLAALSACDDEDDRFVIPDRSPLGIWRDDVAFVDATNVPQVQIDRFVEANGMDTVVTATNLVYEILAEGSGELPSATDTVVVNYRGYHVDGRIFDETDVSRGATRGPATGFIAGFSEALRNTRPGGRTWVLIRPSLGYGNAGLARAGITGNSVIVFEIDLVEVVPGP